MHVQVLSSGAAKARATIAAADAIIICVICILGQNSHCQHGARRNSGPPEATHLTYFLLGTRAGQGPQPVFAGFLGDPKAKCSFLAACVPPLERSVVLTRLSKDKAKSQGAQGTLNLRAVVKLKMAAVAVAETKEVEMSSAAAEEPPQRV